VAVGTTGLATDAGDASATSTVTLYVSQPGTDRHDGLHLTGLGRVRHDRR